MSENHRQSESGPGAASAPSYDELAALAGLAPGQRDELARDVDLAVELLREAIGRPGVRFPAAYAVTAFRKRQRRGHGARIVPSAQQQLDVEPGPPDRATIERVVRDPHLRQMVGPAIAAALRRHGEPVPTELQR